MKILTPVLLVSLLFTSCGEKAANASGAMGDAAKNATGAMGDAAKNATGAMGDAAKNVGDLTKQTAVFDKLKSSVADLTKSLTGITDGATAEKAKGTLEGLVTKLKGEMGDLAGLGKLAGNLGTMKDTLLSGATAQIGKLMGNADITKAIGPVLEQLKGVLMGK